MNVIYSLDDKLVNSSLAQYNFEKYRRLSLPESIDKNTAEGFIEDIQYLNQSKSDIQIDNSSYGGEVNYGFILLDILNEVKKDNDILMYSKIAASFGAVIAICGGTKGKRYINKEGRLILHQVRTVSNGSSVSLMTNTLKQANKLIELEEKIEDYIVANSNISKEELHSHLQLETDWEVNAQDCLKYGFVDHIGNPFLKGDNEYE